MTGPSSGDRPAEEPRSICGVEHEDTEGYWTCTLAAGHRSPHGAFDYETQDLLAAWPATPPAVRTGDESATVEQDALPWHVDPLDSHRVVDRDGYGVATAFAAPDAARIVVLANTALSTPPPVSGTAPAPVPYDQHEREVLQLIDERDRLERIADRLAAAIAPADVLGEHSSDNNPWKNALDYAEERHGPVSGTATRDDVARVEALAEALAGVGTRPGFAELPAWERWTTLARVALGGSQPTAQPKYGYLLDSLRSVGTHAAQPVQPAEEQRPIDLLTEQGDEGKLARVRELTELSRDHGIRSVAVDELLLILDGDGGDRG